jgi:hypothetical protein
MLKVKKNHKFAVVILLIIALINVVRGLFHYLAPDSGSHSVAGMDIATAAGPNIVYLLAIIGSIQLVNGLLFIYIALKQKQMVLAAFWYELLTSTMVLFLNFVFKQPVTPVPGRFANIAEFVIVLVTIILIIYFEKRGSNKTASEK